MDLGLFRRRQFVFWLWIICPLILTAGIHFSVFLYCRHMAETLQERRAMAELLPDLVDAQSLAETSIDAFPSIRATAADARSEITTRVSELSAKHNFVVNSLRIGSAAASGPVKKLEVTIEGEGSLLAVMKFVNEFQTPESLTSLLSASVRINTFLPTLVYNCELELETGFAPSMRMTPKASATHGGGAS
jgi:hypothetical protein